MFDGYLGSYKLLMLDDLSLHVNVVVINPKTTSLKFTQLYTIYSLYLKSPA